MIPAHKMVPLLITGALMWWGIIGTIRQAVGAECPPGQFYRPSKGVCIPKDEAGPFLRRPRPKPASEAPRPAPVPFVSTGPLSMDPLPKWSKP